MKSESQTMPTTLAGPSMSSQFSPASARVDSRKFHKTSTDAANRIVCVCLCLHIAESPKAFSSSRAHQHFNSFSFESEKCPVNLSILFQLHTQHRIFNNKQLEVCVLFESDLCHESMLHAHRLPGGRSHA